MKQVSYLIVLVAGLGCGTMAQVGGASTSKVAHGVGGGTRIYIGSLGDGATAEDFRGAIIDAVVRSGRFTVTENGQNADATLEETRS